MLEDRSAAAMEDLAVLAEPARRQLYRHVIEQPGAVSRDEAARALGISRALAAFHLDRLVEAGLLVPEYRRLGERRGPGAGRPSKLYRRADREILASLPQRKYEVAAELFAEALSEPPAGPDDVAGAARRYGLGLGAEVARRAGPRAGSGRRLEAMASVLRDAGYAPFVRNTEIRLLNCPFHELAQRHRALTCGMNVALLEGLLEGAMLPQRSARFDPEPGLCCVASGESPAVERPATE